VLPVIAKVEEVEALDDHKLKIEFDDGISGVVNVSDRLHGPVFEPLKDPEYFSRVEVDEYGAICWPNEADLAPGALYEEIKSRVA
jgi:hypothetical protein